MVIEALSFEASLSRQPKVRNGPNANSRPLLVGPKCYELPEQPCPAIGGTEARDRLVRVFGGAKGTMPTGHIVVREAPMKCRSEGSAGGTRTAAWCYSPAFGDLSCVVVRSGAAVRWARYWRDHRC